MTWTWRSASLTLSPSCTGAASWPRARRPRSSPTRRSVTCISGMPSSPSLGTATDGALLRVDDIHTYYGDSYVLQGVSLTLHKGQIAAILGRNGMGKTTLIRSLAGLTPPRSGEIDYGGVSLRGK